MEPPAGWVPCRLFGALDLPDQPRPRFSQARIECEREALPWLRKALRQRQQIKELLTAAWRGKPQACGGSAFSSFFLSFVRRCFLLARSTGKGKVQVCSCWAPLRSQPAKTKCACLCSNAGLGFSPANIRVCVCFAEETFGWLEVKPGGAFSDPTTQRPSQPFFAPMVLLCQRNLPPEATNPKGKLNEQIDPKRAPIDYCQEASLSVFWSFVFFVWVLHLQTRRFFSDRRPKESNVHAAWLMASMKLAAAKAARQARAHRWLGPRLLSHIMGVSLFEGTPLPSKKNTP